MIQYVFSQASSLDELLTVILQIQTDGKIIRISREISELTKSTKSASKLQNEVENILDDAFGKVSSRNNHWSVGISALFISASRSFNLNFFNRKEHIVFLKQIAGLRTENGRLKNDIKRIFKREF